VNTSLDEARRKWGPVIEGAGLSHRVALLYAAVYLHYGVYGAFMPLWFQHKGMSSAQIGTLIALPVLLRVLFVAPVTALADRLRRVREVLFVCIALTAALVLVLQWVSGYVALLVFFTLFAVAWDPLPILADGYASAAVRVRNLDFGRMRMWGTISLVCTAMAGGRVLDHLGVDLIPVLTCLLLLAPLLIIPFLPPDRLFGESVRAAPGEWRCIINDGPAMLVLVGVSLLMGSSAILLGFGAIQWSAKGLSNGSIGLLYGVAAASEILVFSFAQTLLGKRSELWLLVVGAALTTVRWLGMATDPGFEVLTCLALLQGPSATATIAGSILYIARRFPTHLVATANGVNAVLVGISASAAIFAGGYLWEALKALAYLPMAGMSLVALAIFLVAVRRQRRSLQSEQGLVLPITTTTP
jgi:MFS transporter, PPP family, 3-phenylpropionic acid transporter